MHFVIHVFSNHFEVLHDVTPIDLLDQSAVLSDGVVASCLHKQTFIHLIYANHCRGGLACPPYGTVPHNSTACATQLWFP